jgi:hypothetical protein
MSAVIFAGPSLSREPEIDAAEVVFLPPAAHGDVYRAALKSPAAIGLIDGFFETVPAVWHKEILFALSKGVHVFGGASMGALRAAELHSFGMIGVGRIFEAYRGGIIEDDDEVAVMHGPAELGYQPLSEAMVNVRATVERAEGASIVNSASVAKILRIAKSIFYKERTWTRLLEAARANGVSASECDTLAAWLPSGRVDQKREDAVMLLGEIRALVGTRPSRFSPSFQFQETTDWLQAVQDFQNLPNH